MCFNDKEDNYSGYVVSKASWFCLVLFVPANVEYTICTVETESKDLQNQSQARISIASYRGILSVYLCLYLPAVCKRCLILWSVVSSRGFFPSEFLDDRSAPCSNSSSTSFAPPTLAAACKGVSRPRPHCTSAPGENKEQFSLL